jgi:hypothetical protein
MLLYLTHMWTFKSYAADIIDKQFNRRSQSFLISDLTLRIRGDLMTPHTSFSKIIVYGPNASLSIISSLYGIWFFTQNDYIAQSEVRGGAVLEALCYKPEGRGIDSRWCYWNFSLT